MVLRRLIPMMAAIAIGALATATVASAFDGVMPVPVPGGQHIFAPGPASLGLQGLQANPSSIGDFDGTLALAYLKGHATGVNGQRFRMQDDMRVMTGTYLAADGSRHVGSFAFI
jgi:hypothetical protein